MRIVVFIIVCLLVLGEVRWLPIYVKKKLRVIIQSEGGQLIGVERISARDSIYSVTYLKNGERVKKMARYTLVWGIEWLS